MQAYTYSRYGGPDVLKQVSLPKPEPAPDEVIVKVKRDDRHFGGLSAAQPVHATRSRLDGATSVWVLRSAQTGSGNGVLGGGRRYRARRYAI